MTHSKSTINLKSSMTSTGYGPRARCTGLTPPNPTRRSANPITKIFTNSIFKNFFAAVAAICLFTNAAETSNLPPPIAAALNSNAANLSAAFTILSAYASTSATFYNPTSAYKADSFNNTSIYTADLTFQLADSNSAKNIFSFETNTIENYPFHDAEITFHLTIDSIVGTKPKVSCPGASTTATTSSSCTFKPLTIISPLFTFNEYSLRATYDHGSDLYATNKNENFKENNYQTTSIPP